jgi:hypothetical protein
MAMARANWFRYLLLLPVACVACTPQQPTPVEPAAAPAPPPIPTVPTTLIVTLQDPAMASPAANAAAMIIAARLVGCWQSAESTAAPTVALRLDLDLEGAVEAVDVVDRARFATEADYRAAATTATGAIFKCSPFALPAESHASWKSLIVLVTPHHA